MNSKASTIAKITALTPMFLILYRHDLILVGNQALTYEASSHILVFPFLFGYILYRKRKVLGALVESEKWGVEKERGSPKDVAGLLIFLLSLLIYWNGSYTFSPLEYHLISIPVFLSGLMLLFFSVDVLRVLAVPLAFLLFILPPPLSMIYVAGAELSLWSSSASYSLLRLFGLPIELSMKYGTPVLTMKGPFGTPIALGIDLACSGIYSLIGFALFASFITYLARGPVWKKTIVFLIGFPLFILLNTVRITTIALIGYRYGEEMALSAFHLLGGLFLIFMGAVILMTLSGALLKMQFFGTMASGEQDSSTKGTSTKANARQAYRLNRRHSESGTFGKDICKIAVLLACVVFLSFLEIPVFAITYAPSAIVKQGLLGEEVSTQVLPSYPGYEVRFVFRDRAFENMTKEDASLLYYYEPINTTETPVWALIDVAGFISGLHIWEGCIRPAKVLELSDIKLVGDPPITARLFVFDEPAVNKTQVILYWFERVFLKQESGYYLKFIRFSLIAYAEEEARYQEIVNSLIPLGRDIINYWEPLKTTSWISLVIATLPASLVATVVSLAIFVVSRAIAESRIRRANRNVVKRLLDEEKKLFEAIRQAGSQGVPSADAISLTYQKTSGEETNPERFLEKLLEAEKTGLIYKKISDIDDKPVLTWKVRA